MSILIAGAILAVITALLSEKGLPKTIALIILGILIGGFIIIVLSFILFATGF
ncbi:hypothetical protein [Bacillus seohaeanensis]|uniref:Major facilitator superfamily (MFS) profile domain-containing protein n=1 Tax=Bacillus seohaeanensis TaxID=284580 RepID=A0ABW5RX41_9BACI